MRIGPYYPPGTYLVVYDFETRFEPHSIDPYGNDWIKQHGYVRQEKVLESQKSRCDAGAL